MISTPPLKTLSPVPVIIPTYKPSSSVSSSSSNPVRRNLVLGHPQSYPCSLNDLLVSRVGKLGNPEVVSKHMIARGFSFDKSLTPMFKEVNKDAGEESIHQISYRPDDYFRDCRKRYIGKFDSSTYPAFLVCFIYLR